MCDEMERSLHDALCVVKRVLESKSVVPGGGAVEAALSIYLENYATSMVRQSYEKRVSFLSMQLIRYLELIWHEHSVGCTPVSPLLKYYSTLLFPQGSREQLAIAEFARSLLVIPKTLAVNAAQDSTDLVAKLRAFHNEAQVNPERKNLKWWVLPYCTSCESKVTQMLNFSGYCTSLIKQIILLGAKWTLKIFSWVQSLSHILGELIVLCRTCSIWILVLCCRIGLDLVNGKPRDNRQAGVYEPTMVKTKSLKFATEAAITILRIDDLIKLFPEPKEGGQSYQDAVHSGALDG